MPLNKRIEDSCICNICGKFCREENAKCGKPFFFFEVIRLSFKGKRMRTDYIHNIICNAFTSKQELPRFSQTNNRNDFLCVKQFIRGLSKSRTSSRMISNDKLANKEYESQTQMFLI